MKKYMLWGTSILKAFWMDFGRVLGNKIINFCIFSHVFWKQISNNVLEATKIEKNVELDGSYQIWALDSGAPHAPGERKREGFRSILNKPYCKKLLTRT